MKISLRFRNLLFKTFFSALLLLSAYAGIAQCTAPTATVVNNTSCNSNNGSITVTGPTPLINFEFSKDGGITFQASNVFTGLGAGNYGIVARRTDLSCVSSTVNFTVTNAPAVVATPATTNTNPASCITPDGSITVTSPAPLGNYEFSIDNGLTFQAGAVFSNLAAGTYQVLAKSIATGCVSAALAVNLTNPAIATPAATLVNPTNCSTPNGSISFTAPAPLANFQFSINNGTSFQPGEVFTNLAAGTYQLRAMNIATGCISAATLVTLNNPAIAAPIVSTANVTSCNSNNGSITVTAPTPLINYEFSKDLGVNYQPSNIFSGLAAGNYAVMVRQLATGCVSLVNYVALTSVPVLPATPTATSANPTNCDVPNGSITVTGPTPLLNFEFSIDNGATFQASNIFNGLPGGTYLIRARDLSTNCTSAALSRVLTNPAVVAPTAAGTNPTLCNVSNGSITVTAPTPLANFQFSNDNGATFQASNIFTALGPGAYQMRTKNIASGCVSATAATVTLTNPAATTPTLTSVNNTICTGAPNGSITVTAPVPLANYMFSNDNGVTFQASNIFTGLAAATYPVRVKLISSDCISAAVNRVITNAPVAVATPTFTQTNPTNCTVPNGIITITGPAPLANYQFSINNGVSFQAGNVFSNLPAGTYQLKAKLISTGCISATATCTLVAPAVTTPTVTFTNNTICSGTPNGSITVTAPTPLANFQFSINNGSAYQTSNIFTGLAAGTYLVRAKSNATGCQSAALSRAITLAPAVVTTPTLTVTQPTSCTTPNGSVTVNPVPAVPANFQYSKDNGVTFQASNIFPGLAGGAYQFRTRLISTGCMSAAVASTLTNPAVATPTATAVNNTNCSLPNGSITATGPTPLANFEFSIDNGVTFQASNVFNNLVGGTYSVRAKNIATGCISAALSRPVTNATVVVAAPTLTSTNPFNCAPGDGVITVTAPTPLANYHFSVDDGVTFQAGNVFTGLAAGTYHVKARLISTGCISPATNRILTAPAVAMPTVTKVNATDCIGNGSLTVTSPAPLANYTFSNNNGVAYQPAPGFSNLPAGIYKVVVKNNATGCVSPVNQLLITTTAVCAEICNNGIDDDKDGLADEMDPDCGCDPDTYNSGCASTCQYQIQPGGLSIKKAYQTPTTNQISVYQTPMVGDIDRDGVNEILLLSNNLITNSTTRLARDIHIFNGKTGALKSTIATADASGVGYDVGWSAFPVLALANVDDDPESEIIVLSCNSAANITSGNDSYLFCYNPDGSLLWKSNIKVGYATMDNRYGCAINIADFNADGISEVYIWDQVFNARTGVLLVQGGGTNGMAIRDGDLTPGVPTLGVPGHPVAAELLPNSPGLELACGRTVYTVNITNIAGTAGNSMTAVNAPALSWGAAAATLKDGMTAIADMDADGALDVVVTWAPLSGTQAMVYAWNPRTATIMAKGDATQVATAQGVGVPFVGNFDTDCGLEVGFCGTTRIFAFDYAPTTMTSKWTLVTGDASGLTGLTLFDFNQDGKAEIVYRDEDNIRVIDAATATDVVTPIPCISGTAYDMPVVADVKGNGTAQICVTCGLGASFIEGTVNVFESGSQPWAPARSVWNQQAYHVTNINDDLSVPLVEYNNATALEGASCTGCKNTPYNNFLQQATFRTQGGCVQFPAADAVASNVSVVYGCDSSRVFYTISNNADVAKIAAGMPIAFYNGDPSLPGAVLIGRDTLQSNLTPGASVNMSQGLVLTPLGPSFTLYVVVNDTGRIPAPVVFPITNIPECNYTNNISAGTLVVRPTAGANPPTICQNNITVLSATGSGAGFWTADPLNPDMAPVIADTNATTTNVTGFVTPGNYLFIWNFNGCKDTVQFLVNPVPDAGPDQTVDCRTTDAATLTGTQTGNQVWTLSSANPGTAVIADSTAEITTVTGFSAAGIYLAIWKDTLTGCTDTVQITASENCAVVPLDLVSFTATKKDNTALLKWITATEINTDKFIVERSRDAIVWNTIGTVQAAGTSNVQKSYSFIDGYPFTGINYYRLRMTDIDGSFTKTEIRFVSFKEKDNGLVIMPNPTEGIATITFSAPLAANSNIIITNNAGQLVKTYSLPAGITQYMIDLSAVSKGIYIVSMKGAGIDKHVKLLVK